MPSNLAEILTTTVTAGTYDVPDGATEIFINNIGSGNATWKGNHGNSSTNITLKPNATFAYGYIGRGRKTFTIDASATIVEVSVTF